MDNPNNTLSVFLIGIMLGWFLGYAIAKPAVVRAKIRELRGR